MVKTVTYALPTYSMQSSLLPKSFCEELNMMKAKFGWSGDLGKRKMHWLNWRVLCKPKMDGGLGFRDLYAFNLALLAKQAWRFMRDTKGLVYHVFKARYFPNIDFLNARVTANSSYVWHSIAASPPVLQKGLQWQVGDRKTIRIWKDNWVPRETCLQILTPPPVHYNNEATVEGLLWVESK
ncbi:uncharacterized mitochondrial protein AtMg00310-like [Malus sylvestris]|uniref:uncharacterized mitochondrial protein AtMg00310-like n=1 Tax=Malus sylvestris TaxID=3752 RepID=UPI0021AC6833|nr:uncharacterized mitochondrial protein AtMg00310-like [Malus sylvestris]